MISRARAWLAGKLVAAASSLVGGTNPVEIEEEDDQLPPGAPAVVIGPAARAMLATHVPSQPKKVEQIDAPLAGSLRARKESSWAR